MLKKENRLKAKAAFDATYKNRLSVSDKNIILYAGKYKQDKNCPTRVGFVVSKKISKLAVKRNRIKRLMREVVREIFIENNLSKINNFQSLIFLSRADILDKNIEDIRKSILSLLDKLANKKI